MAYDNGSVVQTVSTLPIAVCRKAGEAAEFGYGSKRLAQRRGLVGETHCPCCGQSLPGPFPSVTGDKRKRLVELIARKPGLHRNELTAMLYADDIDGGPQSTNIVSVILSQAKAQLKADGYKVRSSRWTGYSLVPVT